MTQAGIPFSGLTYTYVGAHYLGSGRDLSMQYRVEVASPSLPRGPSLGRHLVNSDRPSSAYLGWAEVRLTRMGRGRLTPAEAKWTGLSCPQMDLCLSRQAEFCLSRQAGISPDPGWAWAASTTEVSSRSLLRLGQSRPEPLVRSIFAGAYGPSCQ